MSIKEFIEAINKSKKNTELTSLYKRPMPEVKGQMPITPIYDDGVHQQADLLFLPHDGDFKYLLVCVDLSGSVDAEPLKEKTNAGVIKAFKSIYSRDYLDKPLIITLDAGSEFKGETEDYFTKMKANVKYALVGRHRQLAVVERMNQKIGTILLKRMASQELLTGETSREWVDDIPELIEYLNQHKRKPPKETDEIIADKYSGNLLEVGQKVRILLDYPINNTDNKRLSGKFRSGDIKWSVKTYTIKEVLLKPNSPPMYLTSNNDDVARTKNQLQVVSGNEEEPDPKFIRGNPEHYIVSKILDKRKLKNKVQYKVKWKGYPESEATWINREELDRTKELKEMRIEYDSK
jgi:hypothetical protein